MTAERTNQSVAGRVDPRTRSAAPVGSPPNVVIVVLDDTGFAQLGSFGSDIDTPRLDRLAGHGLIYNRFHVTAVCSPTRACVLTGRNSHAVGMGFVPDVPLAEPGYSGRIPKTAATVARVLRDAGYSTLAVGKWHLTPRHDRTASGPFDLWPLGVGFERFYGFLHADTNQWTPNLVCDNHFVDPPARPEDGYHLTEDLVDTAIRYVADQQHATPGKPFFLYLATGAMHAPHHVPRPWIDQYAGRFDDGWERWRERTFERQIRAGIVPENTVLTQRPPWVQAWDDLPGGERALYASMQEVFAGFLSHTDHHLGRLLSFLEDTGSLDNTVIVVLSDNGASAEGGQIGSINEHRFPVGRDRLADNLAHAADLGGFRLYNHYPWGWAWAGNTPLRLWKRYTWLGGTRTPLIVHWPAGIVSRGAVRSQFCHAVDIVPTVLDAVGIAAPAVVDGVTQQPIDGASLVSTFDDGEAPDPRSTQYFELLGSRSIYQDGWKATTDHVSSGVADEERLLGGSRDFATDRWSLSNLAEDFSEATDLAADRPDLVRRLEERWWAEAGRNHVLPLNDSIRGAAFVPAPYPPKARTVFRPEGSRIADEAVPSIAAGGRIMIDVTIAGDAEGVLCAQGDWSSGWALYVKSGRLTYALSALGDAHHVSADEALPAGRHHLGFTFTPDGSDGPTGSLIIDDRVIASHRFPPGVVPGAAQFGGGGLRLGHDAGFPVCDDYQPPYPWNGILHDVIIEVGAAPPTTVEDEVAAALHRD